ncbi:MAG: hypothetical protein DWQ07_20770 [Chloroflexi bacterium]|nr:MAG: hypothetical protein DWQ07_20770 [Chloroflexota bacterium]MBL1194518.1 hypothetical protein [Chloroflexota bacterium]
MYLKLNGKLLLSVLLIFAFVLAGCGGAAATETMTEDMDAMEHEDNEMDMDEGEHKHDAGAEVVRVPNDGAVVSIQSPADGASFAANEGVLVEIAVANFTLGEDNNHWHVYVNGVSWGMITGEDTSHVLQGIEPGEHLVEVYLAVGTHEELENGDSITIIINEN